MSTQAPGFHYSLNALLRKRRVELDGLTAELIAARATLEQGQRDLERARTALTELAGLQRQLWQQGQRIDLDAQWRLHDCQGTAAAQVREQTRVLAQAQGQWEASLGRVQSGRQAVRVLEEHREANQREFVAAGVRLELAAVDELFLAKQSNPGRRIGLVSHLRRL
jgi:hypothetical protein